jgi:ABC-type branched-subunit amino acid transport system ATPase component
VLDVREVTKRFAGLLAVDRFSHHFPPTGIAGVIGPNGAGKSTLLHLISGFHGVDEGEICLAGDPITGWSPSQRARAGLMRTFQFESGIPRLNVLENVLLGLYGHARCGFLPCLLRTPAARREERAFRARAHATLDGLGLGDLADHDSQLLTYGQVKLLGIARSMVVAPRVLLLDEPAAGLSSVEIERLAVILREVAETTLIVLVEHNFRFLTSVATEVIVLDFGRKIFAGRPRDAVADPTVIEAFTGSKRSDGLATIATQSLASGRSGERPPGEHENGR